MTKTQTAERRRYPKPADYVPEPVFPEGHRLAGSRRCKAWNPNAGRQCGLAPMKNKEVCGSHGGKSPRGAASPHFKHGKYAVPDALTDAYQKQRTDPALLELREEIALIDSRLMEVVAALDLPEAESTWIQVRQQVEILYKAMAARPRHLIEAETATVALKTLVNEGIDYYFRWREIAELAESRRRLVETERKRHKDLYEFLTVERLFGLIAQIGEIVRPELPNENSRRRVETKIRQLVS